MPTRKLLVSGASGFVGGFLLERLQENDTHSIVALHHRKIPANARHLHSNCLTWSKTDLACDDLTEQVQGIDTVFHLAGSFSLSENVSDQQMMERVNVEGTQRLAEACKAAGVRHFIFTSSVAACEENSFYGKTKKTAEDLLLSMAGDGFNVTILRATALFGEHHQGSLYELARTIQNGRFVIFGNGENRVSFYYIRDFVDALVSVSNNPDTFGKVLLATDTPCSLDELSSIVANLVEYKKTIPHFPKVFGRVLAGACDAVNSLTGASLPLSTRRFRAMVQDVQYSGEDLYRTLGNSPAYGLKEGLKRTIQSYRTAGLL